MKSTSRLHAFYSTPASRKTSPAASTRLRTPAAAIAAMKLEAAQLRSDARLRGTVLSHCAALESVARAWGHRNWNTALGALRARDERQSRSRTA